MAEDIAPLKIPQSEFMPAEDSPPKPVSEFKHKPLDEYEGTPGQEFWVTYQGAGKIDEDVAHFVWEHNQKSSTTYVVIDVRSWVKNVAMKEVKEVVNWSHRLGHDSDQKDVVAANPWVKNWVADCRSYILQKKELPRYMSLLHETSSIWGSTVLSHVHDES